MDEFNRSFAEEDRRTFLTKFGKAAIVAPPVVTVLLSTSMSSPAIARSTGGPASAHGNNGVGNGYDPQPPGNPPVNDGWESGPGHPGNNGGGGNNAHSNAGVNHGNGHADTNAGLSHGNGHRNGH